MENYSSFYKVVVHMWKIVIGVLIALIILALLFFLYVNWMNKSNAEYVLDMLREHEESSFYMTENGTVIADIRANRKMKLASTVKIMVALEYAYQVSEGKVDPQDKVSLGELEKYYIPKLDGGGHEMWLKEMEETGHAQNGRVSLREVAKGMIRFSSNANTVYLMEILGLVNIENRMKAEGIRNHSPLFYFEAATFIPWEIKQDKFNSQTMKEVKDEILSVMKKMSDEEWRNLSGDIHEKLRNNPSYQKEAKVLDWWNDEYDGLFSERFIEGTAKEYAILMKKINDQVLDPAVQNEMEYLMGGLMEDPGNRKWLKRAGKKGGSTRSILTDSMYVEDLKGNRYEIAVFFNGLEGHQFPKLMASLNEFEYKLLTDPSFKEKLKEIREE
jgi:D-alanyl-D-alanine carboxypeptidase